MEDLLAAGYLIMRNDNEHTLDFHTSPQPTSYVKKERKKKPVTNDEGAGAAPVFIDASPCEPPVQRIASHRTYTAYSPYSWDE